MSYPHEVVRVTLSGTMFNGNEIWSTGFFLGHEGADADPITEQGVADVGAAWSTFWTSATSLISNKYAFTTCKMVRVAQDGKTIADSAVYWSPSSAPVGGYGNPTLPPQIALVATLANSLPRGLATKGRMFLPGVASPVDSTGHVNTTEQTQLATNLKTFFDSVYNDADLPGNPVLASLGRGPLLQGGAIRNVTQIRIGNVYDTQRRRRNALTETYVVKPVAGG